jgi:hypothetical protein
LLFVGHASSPFGHRPACADAAVGVSGARRTGGQAGSELLSWIHRPSSARYAQWIGPRSWPDGPERLDNDPADCREIQLRLDELEPQLRMAALEFRQYAWQQLMCERRNDAQAQRSDQRTRAVAGAVGKIADRVHDASCAARHFATDLGEGGCPLLALDELGPKLILELADLHRQGWLAAHFLGGAPEGAGASQCIEILQLAEGQHRHKICDCGTGIFGSAPAACRGTMQRVISKISTWASTKSTI